MRQNEHHEQAALMTWALASKGRVPELALLFAIPNGGHRHRITAAKLKAEGVRAGVPDLFLPVPRGGRHGLFIELKYGRNTTTPEQTAWLEALSEQGYAAVVAYGAEQGERAILDYLSGRPDLPSLYRSSNVRRNRRNAGS